MSHSASAGNTIVPLACTPTGVLPLECAPPYAVSMRVQSRRGRKTRMGEILRNKEYHYLEEKVALLEVRDDSLLVKISFLIDYKKKMIAIEKENRSCSRLRISR